MFYYLNIVAMVIGYIILMFLAFVCIHDRCLDLYGWSKRMWVRTRCARVRELEKENDRLRSILAMASAGGLVGGPHDETSS